VTRRLTLLELNRATLARQGLLQPLTSNDPAGLIEHIGSLQAQHPDWPALALHSRLPTGVALDLNGARAARTVVRASLMRITVHLVSARDFWPMSVVSLPYRRRQWQALFKMDPATSALGRRIRAAHPAAIAAMEERPLAIHEIESSLRAEIGDVELPGNRCLWRHITAFVPLIQVPHDGERYGRARYVPADTWLGPPTDTDGDLDAAALRVAERYLAAFGPASVADLAAYVGRGRDLSRWRRALAQIGDRLVMLHDATGREMLDLADAPRPAPSGRVPPRLLARWDSLLLAYDPRQRARVLPDEHRGTVITRNADVLPTFLVDGFIAGTWLPRHDDSGQPVAELRPFAPLDSAERAALEEEADRLLPTLGDGAFGRYPGTD